jgi:uncharacterized protein DUF4440
MRHALYVFVVVTAALMVASQPAGAANSSQEDDLLAARESVWRTFFEGDTRKLETFLPPETITINSGDEKWENQADVLKDSADFKASGGKLIRLEFPVTKVQHFGGVAIIYSQYLYEIEKDGKRLVRSGRVTEIFVHQNGHWTNPGWHTDAGVIER